MSPKPFARQDRHRSKGRASQALPFSMIELGYSNFPSDTFHAVLAPNGTPLEIIERVATSLLETLRQPTLHKQLRSQGFEVIGNGPDGLRRRIELEVPAYRDLIVKVGIAPV